jgi:hypothetical protein
LTCDVDELNSEAIENRPYRLTSAFFLVKIDKGDTFTLQNAWSKQLLLFPLVNIPSNPSEFCNLLYSYVHNAITPAFHAFIDGKPSPTCDNCTIDIHRGISASLPIARKKIIDLELSLLHLREESEIPEIRLQPDPKVLEYLEQVCLNMSRESVSR